MSESECPDDSEFHFFYHQIVAKLPQNATEKVRLLEYVRNLFFLESFFFNVGKGGKFGVECVSNDLIS